MPYPPSPWDLTGFAFFSLQAIEIEKARPFIPPDLEIVSFFPNYTIGGVYIASYRSGSVLEYNELIIAPAFVRYRDRLGGWISHIYVDNEDSVSGGREIWGLPKEMAEFRWNETAVNISQQERSLCNFSVRSLPVSLETWWRPSLEGTCLSYLNNNWLSFNARFKAKISIVATEIDIPVHSPFHDLKISRSLINTRLDALELTTRSPRVIR